MASCEDGTAASSHISTKNSLHFFGGARCVPDSHNVSAFDSDAVVWSKLLLPVADVHLPSGEAPDCTHFLPSNASVGGLPIASEQPNNATPHQRGKSGIVFFIGAECCSCLLVAGFQYTLNQIGLS
eukprot:CAMPEP_0172724856 /NCGR_PEP_ID=MMETSP1074-20121228/87027_1 /TAXON_ID=2916 /ORGANISM="Ceratium fusus, Strain PA161109" /LENGTH=125 /DNA_ID=CAMNT_0013551465 /DNA_START=336 /DNA_END=710 /DNA_ORIENTATION=+